MAAMDRTVRAGLNAAIGADARDRCGELPIQPLGALIDAVDLKRTWVTRSRA